MCFLDSYWVCHMNGNGVAPQNEMLYNSNNWPFYLLSPASEIWPVPIWAFRPWKIATSSSHPILHSMYWWADRYHLLWIIKTLIICYHSSTTPKSAAYTENEPSTRGVVTAHPWRDFTQIPRFHCSRDCCVPCFKTPTCGWWRNSSIFGIIRCVSDY